MKVGDAISYQGQIHTIEHINYDYPRGLLIYASKDGKRTLIKFEGDTTHGILEDKPLREPIAWGILSFLTQLLFKPLTYFLLFLGGFAYWAIWFALQAIK